MCDDGQGAHNSSSCAFGSGELKTLKNLLKNEESCEAESWNVASELRIYQVCSNDDPRMTFDPFCVLVTVAIPEEGYMASEHK